MIIPKKGPETRAFNVNTSELEVDGYTIKRVTIATQTPVMRAFGEEKLVITEEAIANFDEFKTTGISLLSNHKPNNRALGMVTNPVVVDGVLKADITFDNTYEYAVDIFKSVVEERQPQGLSISYLPKDYQVATLGESLAESHTVDRFEIYDVSVVGKPADSKSGFLRTSDLIINEEQETNSEKMPEDAKKTNQDVTQEAPKAPEVANLDAMRKQERSAAADLFNLASTHNISQDTAVEWVKNGVSLADAKDAVLSAIAKRGAEEVAVKPPVKVMFTDTVAPASDKFKDGKTRLTFRGAIEAVIANKVGNPNISREAGLAREISHDHRGGNEYMQVPYDVLGEGIQNRAFEATSTTQGGNYITDQVDMSNITRYLFNTTVSGQLGIRTITGLTDNYVVPSETNSLQVRYTGEGVKNEESNLTTSQFTMSPKEGTVITKVTDWAMAQMPAIQGLIRDQLTNSLSQEVDRSILIGGAANQTLRPVGIMTRIGAAVKDPATMGLDDVADAIMNLDAANIPGNKAIVVPPFLVNAWRKIKTDKNPNNFYVWTNNADSTTVNGVPGFIWGVPVYVTTNLYGLKPNGARADADAAGKYRFLLGSFQHVIHGLWGNSFQLEMGYVDDDFARNQMAMKMTIKHDVGVTRNSAFVGHLGLTGA